MDDATMTGLLAATVFGFLGAIIGFIYGFKIRGDVYEQIAEMNQKQQALAASEPSVGDFSIQEVDENIEYDNDDDDSTDPFEGLGYQGWKQKELDRLKKDGVEIGKDGRCKCSCGHVCPMGHVGSTLRCTKEELEAAGHKTRKS